MSSTGRVPVGHPQVFDAITVSCRGCGRAIPPGQVFTRHPVPDDHRSDLTAPFCQTCRPLGRILSPVEAPSTDDLLAALRNRLETQARADSPNERESR